MQTHIKVSPIILEWVLEQIHPETLSDQTLQCLETWRLGKKTPTFNQVEKVSKATGIPLGYFFLQTPPQEDVSLIEFRTVDSTLLNNPSRNLIDTMHEITVLHPQFLNRSLFRSVFQVVRKPCITAPCHIVEIVREAVRAEPLRIDLRTHQVILLILRLAVHRAALFLYLQN